MLISIAMMFLVGMSMGWICKKIHLPSLFGMIVTGIVLGPYVLDVIDASILNISSDLRRIALIIILMRAGLSLDLNDLKKVGRPAVLMCFVPACFEIGGMVLLAPKLLGISILDAAIMGTVIAAVSPAVIVPKMLKLMEEGYGVKKSIPQMILAGASVDDVFVIVMFTAFTGLAQGDQVSAVDFINIPISIAVGALAGFLIGFLSAEYFKKIHIRDTSKVIILVCVSFLLVTFEDEFASVIPFASLIAVMTMGIALQQKRKNVAKRLSAKFNKLWKQGINGFCPCHHTVIDAGQLFDFKRNRYFRIDKRGKTFRDGTVYNFYRTDLNDLVFGWTESSGLKVKYYIGIIETLPLGIFYQFLQAVSAF